MKDFFVHRTVRGLIIPVVIVICVLLAGAGPARAGKNAHVQIGFVGVPPPNFQNVLLNVIAVRINPSSNAGPNNGKWQTIPAPPGIGGAQSTAELQIDLNTSQNIPQLFNIAGVRPDTYTIAQLQLDPNNPGSLVPNCPLAPPPGSTADGCINYPIQLNNGNFITVINTGSGGLVSPKKGQTASLVLQLTTMVNQAPTSPFAPYVVTVSMATLPANALGTVTGTVTVGSGTGGGGSSTKLRPLSVTAEAIGTNTPIATIPVKNGQQFTLTLPAAGGPAPPGFGTLYDLAVAGGGDSYAATRLSPLYPGTTLTANFTVAPKTISNITGTVSDNCVKRNIVGATLQLLVPPDANPGADCTIGQCIAVATANTDNAGNFPLPGTITTPAAFDNIPTLAKGAPYILEVSAPGYDTTFFQAVPSKNGAKGGGTCAPIGSSTFTSCNIGLNTGFVTGSIPIIAPNPGQTTLVQVFAEDAGTNTIESALPMPIVVSSSNSGMVGFTLNVPTKLTPPNPTRAFDLYATTIDLYQGVADPYQGHTIAVKADVTGPAEPSMPGACSTATPTPFDQTIDCVGHGSIVGNVSGADLGTSVVLSKEDAGKFVQVASSQVQNQAPNPGPNNRYAFCVPADTYGLQTVQLPAPSPSVVPTAPPPTPEPIGTPTVIVTIPPAPLAGGPSPTPTPAIKCPTTCSNPNGSCPGICNTVIQPISVP